MTESLKGGGKKNFIEQDFAVKVKTIVRALRPWPEWKIIREIEMSTYYKLITGKTARTSYFLAKRSTQPKPTETKSRIVNSIKDLGLKLLISIKRNVLPISILIPIAFVIIFLILRVICAWPQIFSGDHQSAQYLLSGIGQAMGAIFAFAFTIPLIAIQIAAGKYSLRIFKFFFNKWIVLFIVSFLVMIFFPFLILSQIDLRSNIPTLFIDIDLVITGPLLFLLIPYFVFIMECFKPETLVNKLVRESEDVISKIKIKKGVIKAKEKERLSNNVITLYDLANISIRDVDTPTLRITVWSILTLMIKSESNEAFKEFQEEMQNYFEALVESTFRIGSTKMLTMALYSVLVDKFNAGHTEITKKAINKLYYVGLYSLEYDKRKDAEAVCQALFSTSDITRSKNLELALMSTSFCNAIGISALRPNEPELRYKWNTPSFGRVSQQTIMERVASDLEFIEYAAWVKGNLKIAKGAIEELRKMGSEGLHNKKPKIAKNAIDTLYKIISMSPPGDVTISDDDFIDIYTDVFNATSLMCLEEGVKAIERTASVVYYKIALEDRIIRNKPGLAKSAGINLSGIGLGALRDNGLEFTEQIVDYLTQICKNSFEIKGTPEIMGKLLCF